MKPHISNLRIEAFRGVKSLELRELGQFNLLIGYNNSGKSSVLEAIEYFCRPADPLALINLSRRREGSSHNLDPVQTLRWLFPKDERTPDGDFFNLEISVSGEVADVLRTVQSTLVGRLADVHVTRPVNADPVKPTTTAPPNSDYQKAVVDLKFLYYEGDDENEIKNFKTSAYTLVEGGQFGISQPVEAPAISVSIVTPVSHRIDSSQTKGISSIIRSHLKPKLIELVQLFDSHLEDVSIIDIGGYPEVWVQHAIRGFMPLSSFGDGLRRVIVIAGTLATARGGVLLIDEIETAIHVDALDKTFRWLVESATRSETQVFATTHSLEAVDSMLGVSASENVDLVTYKLAGSQNAPGIVKRFDEDRLLSIRTELGADVR